MSHSVTINHQKVSVDELEYPTIDGLPKDIKKYFVDKDSDSIPNQFSDSSTAEETEIRINGKKYTDWKKVPINYQYLKKLNQLDHHPKVFDKAFFSGGPDTIVNFKELIVFALIGLFILGVLLYLWQLVK